MHQKCYNDNRRDRMFEITLITMGKLKEKFYISAAAEYEKRLKGYCQFKLLELPEVRLPDNPSLAEISAGLDKEAETIFSKIPKGAWFCVLTPEGKMLSSEALADKLKEDTIINASSIFGGIDIKVPKDIAVKVKSCSIFGGVSNKNKEIDPKAHTIYVKSFCLFGGCDIKE